MKLVRWALAGASVFVIYRYSIGKKTIGKDVFERPAREPADRLQDGATPLQNVDGAQNTESQEDRKCGEHA